MPPRKKTISQMKAERGIENENTTLETPIIDTDNDTPSEDFNPLLQDVITRDYAKSNVRVVGGEIPNSVEEPRFQRPTIDLREGADDLSDDGQSKPSQSNGNSNSQPESDRGNVRNPEFDQMTKKAQKASSRAMAKTIVDGYANLNSVLRDHVVKTDMNKLQMEAIKGKFDMDALSVELPISETESVSIGEIIKGTNESCDEIFVCSDEFNEETEELWTEILQEKGLGMTPIQRLSWLYIEDFGKKAIAAWGIWKTNKELLSTAMDILKQQKSPNQPISTEYNAHVTVATPKAAPLEEVEDDEPEAAPVRRRKPAPPKRKPKKTRTRRVEIREAEEVKEKIENAKTENSK